jgi:DNA-binding NarL/FixJ family response regulator
MIRILIAEDHRLVRRSLVKAIRRFGDMEVVAEATNGQEAIDAYEEHEPDVALMDILMPDVDGLKATQTIRQRHPEARIIALSGADESYYRRAALRAGAVSFVQKSGEIDQLFDRIREVHERPGP